MGKTFSWTVGVVVAACSLACGVTSAERAGDEPRDPQLDETVGTDGDNNGMPDAGSDDGSSPSGDSDGAGGSGGSSSDTAGTEPGTTGLAEHTTTGFIGGDVCLPEPCQCLEVVTPVALDDITWLGFSAEQVLAFASGTHEASLKYGQDGFAGTSLNLPDQPSKLTLTVEPTGTASFVTPGAAVVGQMCSNDSNIPTVLQIDVEVSLSTEDGAFSEHFTDQLRVEDAARAHLMTPIDLESLAGNLSLGLPENASFPSLPELYVTIGEDFFVGDITGYISNCSEANCGPNSVTFASWNDSECEGRSLPVHAADEATPAIDRILAQVSAASPLSITWGNGATSDLSLGAAVPEATLCHQPAGALTNSTEERYWLDTELVLRSEDGRLDTGLPVSIEAIYDVAGQPLLAFIDNFEFAMPAEVSAFEETYGLADVAFNGALEGYLYCYLQLSYEAGTTLPSSASGGLDVREGDTVIEPIVISKQE